MPTTGKCPPVRPGAENQVEERKVRYSAARVSLATRIRVLGARARGDLHRNKREGGADGHADETPH